MVPADYMVPDTPAIVQHVLTKYVGVVPALYLTNHVQQQPILSIIDEDMQHLVPEALVANIK